ncbi:MAG: hypothetical protein QXR81_08435 [Candidatus Nezhaarchaeales archaeon]
MATREVRWELGNRRYWRGLNAIRTNLAQIWEAFFKGSPRNPWEKFLLRGLSLPTHMNTSTSSPP